MKKRFLLLPLLPIALLLAAWFGPLLLNWESQRGRVATIATARLGRTVTVEGPLRVTLLPQPMLEADDVRVGDADGETLGVSARVLRLRLGLAPLLTGRLEPRDLVLVGAEIRLPWPPEPIGALRPPPWLTGFDARIEDSRVEVGGVVLDGVSARLAAPGPLDAIRTEGSFTWRGAPARFEAVLGRPGFDGVATLDLSVAAQGANVSARGALVAEGGFEGRIEASGSDLALLMAAPPGPFRATGRVSVTGEVAAADDLAIDLGGVTGRGAATFRFRPEPRLDIALALARIDLDAWVAALRGAQTPPLPVGLDLSAEAASFRGQTIRRLRGGIFREGDRITLTDIAALLPGETEIEAAGATAGGRLELALRFAGPSLRATIAAFGLPVERFDPSRLRAFDGRARLVLEATQLGVPELSATLDGGRVSGAGVFRFGARPALGLGLNFDRLVLDGLLPAPADWAPLLRGGFELDANLRLAAEAVVWDGVTAGRAALDAVMERGRIGLRRASARIGGADVTLAGSLATGPTPRFADLVLEVAGSSAAGLATMAAPIVALPQAFATQALRLRVTGGGPMDALALAAEGELGELRFDGQTTFNLGPGRLSGNLTLRHPGAPRLAVLLGAPQMPAWLGEGSFSLIAALSGSRGAIAADSLELVAGGLRARGQLALALDGARPRLTGRLAAERLPLPGLSLRDNDPLGVGVLGAFDAELAVEAAEVVAPDLPPLREVAAKLRLDAGRLVLDEIKARLGGGAVEGTLAIDAAAAPPVLSGSLGLTGATLTQPLFGLPIDLASGQVSAQGRFSASGHAPAALLGSLAGDGRFAVVDGVLAGIALRSVTNAAGIEEQARAEAAMREGLEGGATALERLEGGWRAATGVVTLDGVRMAGEGGVSGGIEGSVDLRRGTVDLRFMVQPPPAEAPAVALRVSGPADTPRRQPELADWARWRATQ
ncbi:AsmA-like C-terminal region-containing protein [Roseomonas sp. CAU 1739]|uniref:AsmA family protein n=1 Tax=Roseomonas sp. CAU 1739 TaxID=3140364 RepID=UPI00325AD87F